MKSAWLLSAGLVAAVLATAARAQGIDFNKIELIPQQLGPNLTNPTALTWYDADDLLVLDGAGDQTSLWKVPVDGQPATALPGVLPGAISITANSARNALVVGMTQNRMAVSSGLSGPWQPLGTGGQSPAFQAPAIPITPQP